MHNPAVGLQTAKDFDAMHKFAKPSKPHVNHLSTRRPASPQCCERNSHSSYHADDHHRSNKHSPSRSCLHSCSRSRDCYDDDHCSQHSSCPHHSDTCIGHHDFQPTHESHQMEPVDTHLHKKNTLVALLPKLMSHYGLIFWKIPQICRTQSLSVHQAGTLILPFLLEMLIIVHGTLTQMRILTTLFILTAVVIVKTLSLQPKMKLPLIMMMMMTMTVVCMLAQNPPSQTTHFAWVPSTSEITQTRNQGIQLLVQFQTGYTIPNWVDRPSCH